MGGRAGGGQFAVHPDSQGERQRDEDCASERKPLGEVHRAPQEEEMITPSILRDAAGGKLSIVPLAIETGSGGEGDEDPVDAI